MGNLIKYEIKGYWKETLGLISLIVITNILLITKVDILTNQIVTTLCIFLTVATVAVVFVWNIKIFSRDLKENTAYLVQSLPISSNCLLASKLVAAFIQYSMVLLINCIFLYYNASKIIPTNVIKSIHNLNTGLLIFIVFYQIIMYISFLNTIYFSISVSKIAVKKKRKIAKLGSWVVFILIYVGISKTSDILAGFFPKTFGMRLANLDVILINGITINIPDSVVNINIARTVFDMCILVVLFIGTSYLLREKLDV